MIKLSKHIVKKLLRTVKRSISCDNYRPTSKTVSVSRRKRKRSAVSNKQNMVVFGM